jgi:hypothetical protein
MKNSTNMNCDHPEIREPHVDVLNLGWCVLFDGGLIISPKSFPTTKNTC